MNNIYITGLFTINILYTIIKSSRCFPCARRNYFQFAALFIMCLSMRMDAGVLLVLSVYNGLIRISHRLNPERLRAKGYALRNSVCYETLFDCLCHPV